MNGKKTTQQRRMARRRGHPTGGQSHSVLICGKPQSGAFTVGCRRVRLVCLSICRITNASCKESGQEQLMRNGIQMGHALTRDTSIGC